MGDGRSLHNILLIQIHSGQKIVNLLLRRCDNKTWRPEALHELNGTDLIDKILRHLEPATLMIYPHLNNQNEHSLAKTPVLKRATLTIAVLCFSCAFLPDDM